MSLIRQTLVYVCAVSAAWILQSEAGPIPAFGQEKDARSTTGKPDDSEPQPAIEPQSDQSAPADLPQNAIWRIGEFGATPKANGIYRLAYSRDGKMLATRNRENVVSIYDTMSRQRLCEVSGHDNNWIETIDFSPDGQYFVSAAGSSEKVKIWNSQNGKLAGEIETDAEAAYFSDNGQQLIVLGLTHVQRYSWPGLQLVSQKQWHVDGAKRSAMSRDGNLVVYYKSNPRRIYQSFVVDLENKSTVDLSGATSIPKNVVISDDNLWVAASYHRDAKIRLWDLRSPHKSKYQLAGHKETVQSLAFSSDNRILVSTSWDESAIAWDLLSRQAIGEFAGHTDHVNAVAIAPLDYTFATGASGTTDTSTIVWDLRSSLFPEKKSNRNASFEQLWNGMGASFVTTSLAASTKLAESSELYLPLLAARVEENLGQPATSPNVVATIALLDDRSYEVRERATEKLMQSRSQAERQLRDALEQTISTESKYRITKILQQPVERPKINFTDLRRWHRIVFALERINDTQSAELLLLIAQNHPDIDVASDAQGAIERNELRASSGL